MTSMHQGPKAEQVRECYLHLVGLMQEAGMAGDSLVVCKDGLTVSLFGPKEENGSIRLHFFRVGFGVSSGRFEICSDGTLTDNVAGGNAPFPIRDLKELTVEDVRRSREAALGELLSPDKLFSGLAYPKLKENRSFLKALPPESSNYNMPTIEPLAFLSKFSNNNTSPKFGPLLDLDFKAVHAFFQNGVQVEIPETDRIGPTSYHTVDSSTGLKAEVATHKGPNDSHYGMSVAFINGSSYLEFPALARPSLELVDSSGKVIPPEPRKPYNNRSIVFENLTPGATYTLRTAQK